MAFSDHRDHITTLIPTTVRSQYTLALPGRVDLLAPAAHVLKV